MGRAAVGEAMTDVGIDCVALAIFGSLGDGGWSADTWRECIEEVEAAWNAREEWERDDYRHAAREALSVASALTEADR